MEQKENKVIMSLWVNTSKKGEQYLSGKLSVKGGDIDVVGFKNKKRAELKEAGDESYEKQPSWLIYKSEPKESKPAFEDSLE